MDDVQRARYDRVFRAYAGDDEYLTRDCFSRHTRRLAEIRGEAADSPAIAAFDQELDKVFDQLEAIADTDHDGRVTLPEWRAAAEGITVAIREAEAAGGPGPFDGWLELLFRVIDANGDRGITKAEYADWLKALGLDGDTDMDAVFSGFDTDGNGIVSLDEFGAAFRQYWTDFDPTTSAHRWIGP